MNDITRIRKKIARDVFDYQVLREALSDYRKPRDKITRLLAEGDIIRIKKGLYCFGDTYRDGPISREYLANLIYGPSYISTEYALSYYGMIPERVEIITSVTTCRSRIIDTPLGSFSYRMLNEPRYIVSAGLERSNGSAFLIAVPEKALVDKVWTDKRFSGRSIREFNSYLFDDLRLDEEEIKQLDFKKLQVIAKSYNSAKINNLVRFLSRI